MKAITILAIISATSLTFAASSDGDSRTAVERLEAYKVGQCKIAANAGGLVEKPGSRKGKLVFFNAQNTLADTELAEVAALFEEMTHVPIDILACKPTSDYVTELHRTKAALAAFVVEETNTPSSLIALNDGWAIVNVAKLKDNLPQGPMQKPLLNARFRKELAKTFAVLSGASLSQFPDNIMTSTKPTDLDAFQEFIPGDLLGRMMSHYRKIGVTPAMFATYRTACRQGWAPAPTNDVQKAIWDKVHAVPAAPMKIEFDPKKGR